MKKSLTVLVIAMLCGLLVLGCENKETGKKSDAKSPAAGKTEKGALAEGTAATVNGVNISWTEVDHETQFLMTQMGGGQNIPPDQQEYVRQMLRQQALDKVINRTLLVQAADKSGLTPDQQKVDAKIAELTAKFPSPEEFQKRLQATGISMENLKDEVVQNFKLEALLDKELKNVVPATDAEADEYYKKNPQSFVMPERVKASHILLNADANTPEAAKQAKHKKILELQKQIAKGADFAKLAKENSDCPSKAQGGDLGYFERGKMVPAFEEAAFKMKVGEIKLVETPFGYHLIKVIEHQKSRNVPLSEAKEKLLKFLTQKKKEELITKYLEKLRGEAKIAYSQPPTAPQPMQAPPGQGAPTAGEAPLPPITLPVK